MDETSQQPELTPSPMDPFTPALSPHAAVPIAKTMPPKRPWLEREELFLSVMMRLCMGPIVAIAPWSPTLWDRNPLFVFFPTLAIYAANGAVRGVVTGLGLLTLWFALRETLNSRERDSRREQSFPEEY